MIARKWGRIINVSSINGKQANQFSSAYCTAKHGVIGLTRALALDVAKQGITVNAVCPGYVLTPLVQQQIPATAQARGISEEAVVRDVLLAAQPTKRFVTVEQVAAFAAFLCSDAAASITGAVLPIEGGWTAH
jgi:3-hydroxybutyrate dehydrogenase